VIILTLSSTGIRIGALVALQMRHLKRIDAGNLYQFTVYENTKDEYTTFCTPECASAIDLYLEYCRRYGEKIDDESPLVRDQFDKNDPFHASKAKPITSKGLGGIMHGLRTRSTESQKYKRLEVMINHGFRKYFATQLTKAANPVTVELLMGHDIGLKGNYYKPAEEEKLAEYVKGINELTIDEQHRLLVKVRKLENDRGEIASLKERLEKFEAVFQERQRGPVDIEREYKTMLSLGNHEKHEAEKTQLATCYFCCRGFGFDAPIHIKKWQCLSKETMAKLLSRRGKRSG
jgi:hypothetical protein